MGLFFIAALLAMKLLLKNEKIIYAVRVWNFWYVSVIGMGAIGMRCPGPHEKKRNPPGDFRYAGSRQDL